MVEQKLSRADVADYICDRESYWEAMISAGWVMPVLRQSIVTMDWMAQIRAKIAWCPKRPELSNYKTVLHPPPRHTLAKMLYDRIQMMVGENTHPEAFLAALEVTAELVKKKLADSTWLLQANYCLLPSHEIFKRDYRYVPKIISNRD